MVFRMDLIPETEHLHIMKIGMFGFPRSVLVRISDLENMNYRSAHKRTYTN